MSIVIVGAGPNLGAAIARRFGREGMPIGLISRNHDKLEQLAAELTEAGITADFESADIREPSALSSAIGALADRLGPVEVLEYSPVPAREFMQPVLETTVDDLRANLEFSVLGPVAAVTAVIDPMLERASGTLLFTTGGAAINPNPLRAGVGISFAAEVIYARMLHDDLRDRGVHVGHTAVGGSIAPDGDHHPDEVADVLWGHHAGRADFQIRLGLE